MQVTNLYTLNLMGFSMQVTNHKRVKIGKQILCNKSFNDTRLCWIL